MPASVTPTDYLPGILFKTASGGNITGAVGSNKYILIDKADLPKSADADDASITRTLFAILDGIRAGYEAQTDKPTKWTFTMSSGFNSAGDVITRSFNSQFLTNVSGEEVIAES